MADKTSKPSGLDLVWFIRGNELIIVEKPATENGYYETPTKSITNGIILEYTGSPIQWEVNVDAADDPEDISLPFPDIIEMALIDYIKGRLAEDEKDIKLAEYYYQRFNRKVCQANASRTGGLRRLTTGIWGIN